MVCVERKKEKKKKRNGEKIEILRTSAGTLSLWGIKITFVRARGEFKMREAGETRSISMTLWDRAF